MSPADLVRAARVTGMLPDMERGPWRIKSHRMPGCVHVHERIEARHPSGLGPGEVFTSLRRATEIESNAPWLEVGGETVMEDTPRELRRHLPVLIPARGRVLVSGLGLGCVLRGLLAKPDVQHVDVVEIDPAVVEMVWPHLIECHPELEHRVTLHLDDALTIQWPAGARWDFAWHDVHHEDAAELQRMHVELLCKYRRVARHQGSWMLDRVLRQRVRRGWPPFELLEGRPMRRMR